MTSPRDQYPAKKSLVDYIINEIWENGDPHIGTIETEHMRIHRGEHFFRDFYLSDIDDPSGIKFLINPTGASTEAHLLYAANFTAGTRIEIYEGFTPLTTGVQYVALNNKRDSATSADALLYKDCTISGANPAAHRATGALISVIYLGAAGSNPNVNAPGAGGRGSELILNSNVKYLFWVRPDADNTKGTVGFNWYEE